MPEVEVAVARISAPEMGTRSWAVDLSLQWAGRAGSELHFRGGNSTQMRRNCSQLRELAVPLGHSLCRSGVRLTSPRTTGPANPITDGEVSLSQRHSAVFPTPQAPSWWHAHLFLHHYGEVEG